VRGTIFSVRVNEGQTEVSVFEGSVAVDGKDTSETVGESSLARVDDSSVAVEGFDETEQETWESKREVAGPILVIDTPDEGFVAPPGGTVTIKGRTEPGATVTVDGASVETKIGHRFTRELSVPDDVEGDVFAVPVEAADRRGFKARELVEIQIQR
jgi:hypothetical protein